MTLSDADHFAWLALHRVDGGGPAPRVPASERDAVRTRLAAGLEMLTVAGQRCYAELQEVGRG